LKIADLTKIRCHLLVILLISFCIGITCSGTLIAKTNYPDRINPGAIREKLVHKMGTLLAKGFSGKVGICLSRLPSPVWQQGDNNGDS
jgi:hypothetical protein